jgi:hypothetical protein
MKVIISAVAISLFALSINSCSTHQSCPAYSDSMNNGMDFDNANEEIKELNTENV